MVSTEGVGPQILSVQRDRGCDASSNFMLFNSADACPVPSSPDTDTHCHRWKLREGFVCSRKNSLTGRGVAEETEVGRVHCFSVDGEARGQGGV